MIKTAAGREGRTKVTFVLPDTGTPVAVVGDFNDWDHAAHPMKRRTNGTRSVALELDPGRYEYRYLFDDGRWASEDGDGDANSVVELSS